MKISKLILVILILFITLISHSDETTDKSILEKSKSYEFNFGGGYQHSFGFLWKNVDIKFSKKNEFSYMDVVYFSDENYALSYLSSCPQVLLPISFNFYLNNYFGIGLTYDLGFGMMLSYGFQAMVYAFQILNKLRLSHKIGSLKTMRFFILEYGVSLYSAFHFGFNSSTYMFVGPSVFAGYEKTTKYRFCFTTGFIFEAVYTAEQFNSDYPKSYIQMDSWFFHFGIMFRYRFSFYRELK